MTTDELNALADKWHGFAVEEAARVSVCVKSHHAREWAVEAEAMFSVAEHLRLAAFCAAQGMSAGTAETAKQAQGEARQPGPKDAPK